ncbi:lamin tail domain-containing protein [Amycolatopsis pittospori]|uniref:lamin tail domain-containing protein n=1 Tax=Amycolatopsis pittospori TaxID=2749434 RepID=UPI0015F089D8|nr:lamin tail domain-containing protein [Amycolatopsis pittospori]
MRRILGASAVFAMLAMGMAGGVANAAGESEGTEAAPLASSTVVVNEVSTRGVNGLLDEYIELRNVSSQQQDVSGHVIRIYSPSNVVVDTIVLPAGTILQPKGNAGQFAVLIGQNFSGTIADQTYVIPFTLTSVEGIPTLGGLSVQNLAGAKIDGVAFSNSVMTPREGQAATPESNVTDQLNAANTRNILSTDTDNNRQDFSLQLRSPGL